MKRVVFLSILSLCISGCDSSPEKKNVNDLTNDEIIGLCKVEKNQITGGLKEKVKKDITQPFNIDPTFKSEGSPSLASFKYPKYNPSVSISAKDFVEDFDEANTVKVTNQTGSADRQSNSLSCTGLVTYVPSFMYGVEITIPYTYSIKRKDGVLTKDIENGRNINFEAGFNDDYSYKKTTPQINQEEWLSSYLNKLNKRIIEIEATPKSKYVPISSGDLVYLYFANSGRDFTDDEIMSVFSRKWNATNDTFVKDDIKKEEISGIKEKINSYKGVDNVSVAANSISLDGKIPLPKGIDGNPQLNNSFNASDSYIVDNPYNKDLHGFKSDSAGCDRYKSFEYNNQGIVLDPRMDLRKCVLEVSDDNARNVSEKLSSLQNNNNNTQSTANHYLHIDGYLDQGNYIIATIVKSDFSIYTVKDILDKSPELVFTGELN